MKEHKKKEEAHYKHTVKAQLEKSAPKLQESITKDTDPENDTCGCSIFWVQTTAKHLIERFKYTHNNKLAFNLGEKHCTV